MPFCQIGAVFLDTPHPAQYKRLAFWGASNPEVKMTANRGLWPWLFQRLTAAFLVLGLAVHFIVLHFMIERPVTMAKVAERLQAPGWVVFDVLLLLCALYHGLNGLYGVVVDFSPPDGVKKWTMWTFWAAGGGAAVVGIVNLIPFAR